MLVAERTRLLRSMARPLTPSAHAHRPWQRRRQPSRLRQLPRLLRSTVRLLTPSAHARRPWQRRRQLSRLWHLPCLLRSTARLLTPSARLATAASLQRLARQLALPTAQRTRVYAYVCCSRAARLGWRRRPRSDAWLGSSPRRRLSTHAYVCCSRTARLGWRRQPRSDAWLGKRPRPIPLFLASCASAVTMPRAAHVWPGVATPTARLTGMMVTARLADFWLEIVSPAARPKAVLLDFE
jgi:hypothetical protein